MRQCRSREGEEEEEEGLQKELCDKTEEDGCRGGAEHERTRSRSYECSNKGAEKEGRGMQMELSVKTEDGLSSIGVETR
jgi:hypothetical protein